MSVLLLLCANCSLVVDYFESDPPGDKTSDAALPADASVVSDASNNGLLDASTVGCTEVAIDGTCVISCTTPECGNADITCPAGRPCQVNCIDDKACEQVAIDCSQATSCTINCNGLDACDTGGIQCGGTSCDVHCNGAAACEESLIECNADTCQVVCTGASACNAGVCCNGANCPSGQCSAEIIDNCVCPSP